MNVDFSEKIEQSYKKMSKGHKNIANYIMANYDKAAFLTANKLGKAVGVSESTVVRFANSLGYEGYPEMQKELQDVLCSSLTSVQRMKMSEGVSDDEIFEKVLKTDIDNIRLTLNELDYTQFEACVNAMIGAKRIYVMGVRSAETIAKLFAGNLDFILGNVRCIQTSTTDATEQLIHICEGDIFVGISFPRYSRRTVDAMKFASSKGATCIGITDSAFSPLTDIADISMEIRCNTVSFSDSLVAPLSVMNALLAAISQKKKNELSVSLKEMETIWNKNNFYAAKK